MWGLRARRFPSAGSITAIPNAVVRNRWALRARTSHQWPGGRLEGADRCSTVINGHFT
jgi:hypothetical protein